MFFAISTSASNKFKLKYLLIYLDQTPLQIGYPIRCNPPSINHNISQPKMQQSGSRSVLSSNPSTLQPLPHEQYHIESGEYLKSSVYGGLDGVVNTLTVIIAGIAAAASPASILAIGISVMIGDGLGMGLGDYLSARAEKEFILAEEKRELWEVEHKLDDEKKEVMEIYTEKNYSEKSASRLADLFSTNHQAFVNIMMLEELGLVVDDSNPIWNGLVTFLSFALFGFIPLVPYVIGYGINHDDHDQYLWISLVLAAVELFSLGFAKSVLIGLSMGKRLYSGFETLALGAVAVAAAYGVGFIFRA